MELEGSFNCAFLDDQSSGAHLMAKILFSKLPREVKGEVIRQENSHIVFHLRGYQGGG